MLEQRRQKKLEATRRWRERNPDRVAELAHKYYHQHKEKRRQAKREADARYREENKPKIKESRATQYQQNRESVIVRVMRWARTPEGRKAKNDATKKWQTANPEKKLAHDLVHRAIRDGVIAPCPCEVCGAKAEAHHDDYSKPLDVRWLCRRHHAQFHKTAVV